MAKLTKSLIDRSEPGENDYFVWDESLKGFGIRITPRGTKTYLVRYRVGQGRSARQRKHKIGTHGSPWAPDQARREAMRILGEASQGRDPSDVRKAENTATRFGAFAERYMKEHAIPKKKASSMEQDRRSLRLGLLPAFGNRRVIDIDFSDVSKFHASLNSKPYTANRYVALLSKMFSLAESWGVRERHTNPCLDIQKYREERRERFLSKEELERLGQTLRSAECSTINPHSISIIHLLMLTGARKGEIIGLRWEEVDLERGLLQKVDSKTGRKAIPISRVTVEILAALPRLAGNPFVFPAARGDGHFQGLTKDWLVIRQLAAIPEVRLHDLRHTFASISVASGTSLPVLGRILGHASSLTTERYAHLADNPVRTAVNQASELIAQTIEL
jgi:integrase